MGWNPVKKIGHYVKKTVKAVTSAAKNIAKSVVNPVKFTKNLVKNPGGTIAKLAGLDVLFAGGGGAAATTQAERSAEWMAESSGGGDSQARARRIARQGMQGSIPTMLLGQDVADTRLSDDEELAGRGTN